MLLSLFDPLLPFSPPQASAQLCFCDEAIAASASLAIGDDGIAYLQGFANSACGFRLTAAATCPAASPPPPRPPQPPPRVRSDESVFDEGHHSAASPFSEHLSLLPPRLLLLYRQSKIYNRSEQQQQRPSFFVAATSSPSPPPPLPPPQVFAPPMAPQLAAPQLPPARSPPASPVSYLPPLLLLMRRRRRVALRTTTAADDAAPPASRLVFFICFRSSVSSMWSEEGESLFDIQSCSSAFLLFLLISFSLRQPFRRPSTVSTLAELICSPFHRLIMVRPHPAAHSPRLLSEKTTGAVWWGWKGEKLTVFKAKRALLELY